MEGGGRARSSSARILDTHKCVAERRFFTAFLRLVTPRTNSILLHLSAKPQCPLSATKVWEKEAFPLGVTMRASDPLVLVKIQSMNTLKAAEHRRIPERVFGPLGKSHNAIICEMVARTFVCLTPSTSDHEGFGKSETPR